MGLLSSMKYFYGVELKNEVKTVTMLKEILVKENTDWWILSVCL